MFCKLILPCNEIHKLGFLPTSYEELHRVIQNKLRGRISPDFTLKYKDTDDELITLSSDDDLQTAIFTLQNEGQNTLRLCIIPKPENISAIRHDLNLNLLPGIPEALEKSRSSLEDISMGESFALSSAVGRPSDPSPFAKFDIEKIPHVQSMIFDENESFCNLTPFVEKSAVPAASNKKIFTFSNVETPVNKIEKAITSKILNEEQLKVIENIIEHKLDQGLQSKIESIAHELARKFNEELSFTSPGRASPYQCGFFPKSFNRLGSRRNTMQEIKDPSRVHNACVGCGVSITDIVKYTCLTCSNYTCCEECEAQVNHPHPLLKTKPPKAKGNDCELTNNSSAPANNLISPMVVRSNNRNATINPSLLSMNSETNLPTPQKVPTYTQGIKRAGKPQMTLRRGMSMTVMGTASPVQPRFGKTGCESESKYKATIHKASVYDVLNVKPNSSFNINLTVKNSGENKWSDSVKLICINGIYKDKSIELIDLHPAEEKTVTISLTAPDQAGRYLSQWKLHYCEDEEFARPFGKAVFVDIEVDSKERGLKEEEEESTPVGVFNLKERKLQADVGNIQNSKEPDRKLMREMRCSEQVLIRAKMLNDMFPGDIKEKVDFIRNFTTNFDINDIVSSYLSKISHTTTKKRPNWSQNQEINGISTQS